MTSRWWRCVARRARPGLLMMGDAGASLARRPWHAIAMISGITLGVASAICAVVVADTQQAQIDERFDLQRSDHVVVQAMSPSEAGFSAAQLRIVRRLPVVEDIGEFSSWSDAEHVTRSVPSATVSVPVVVVDFGGLAASDTRLLDGAPLSGLRTLGRAPVVWIGRHLSERLGVGPAGTRAEVDTQVAVAGHVFGVAGIVSNRDGFEYVDDAVVMSRATALDTLGGLGKNIRVVAHVRPGSASAVAAFTVRVVDPGGGLALADVTPADGEQLVKNVGDDLRRVGAALGAFVGLVGMVAVANTLMMSVQQRMRELGLRSAMGWSRRRIGALVLTESALAGTASGVLGSALGLAAAAAWCWAHGWTLVMPVQLPLIVVLGGVAASVVGGVLPAWRAASVSPLEAMRS